LEELIHYAMELKRAEQVTKLLTQEDMDGNGLMDIQTFLSHMSYLDLGIKNPNDHRLLLEKYDTFKEEEINITEFCYDFESVMKDLYPDSLATLDKVTSKISGLVE
jgi:Ca2+-binding EF-hand superfamily protein